MLVYYTYKTSIHIHTFRTNRICQRIKHNSRTYGKCHTYSNVRVCMCKSVLLLTDILIQLAKHFLPASAYSFEHTVRQTFFSLHNISHIIERQLYIDMFGMACWNCLLAEWKIAIFKHVKHRHDDDYSDPSMFRLIFSLSLCPAAEIG